MVPPRSTVTVPAGLNITDAPALMLRRYRPVYANSARVDQWRQYAGFMYNQSSIATLASTETSWLLRMGMGSHGAPNTGHAFSGWWGTYGHDHPDYFALLQPNTTFNPLPYARRGPWIRGHGDMTLEVGTTKMCVSNPDVWHQLISLYDPSRASGLSGCEDDGDVGFCTCHRCRAWDAPGQGPDSCVDDAKQLGNCTGQYSDRYARL